MGAATANAGGTKGAVPASAANDQLKFLRADATWVVPTDTDTNTTYSIGSGNTKVITLTGSDGSTSTVTFKDGSDISISSTANNEITITNDSPDSGLPAVLTDGANPGVTSLYTNTAASTVRATIGAGTGDGLVTSLTTTGTSGAATLSNAGVLNIPNYDDNDTTYTAGTGLSLSNANVFSIDSTVVTLTGTQTLTNKTLTTPVIDQVSPSAGLLQIDGAGSVDGGIKLMCYAGTHGQTLKSQPHSAGVTNTMLLPAGADSTLVSEATETVQSLTTTGTSGASTLSAAGVLNIPQYSDNNDVDYINAATFNTGNGILTGTGVGSAGFSVDLDGRYLTSYTETDTLQNVCSRGSTTSTSITMNGSGASGYLYVAGNAANAAPTNSQGMAFAYNNSGGSRENEIFFNPGIVTPADNAIRYLAIINEYLNSSSGNARVTDTLFKLYGNGNLELVGPAATSTIANTYWRMPKVAAPGTGYYLSKSSGSIDLQWTAPPTTGDITSVTAGTGMTGGGTSGGVTLNVIGGNGITANANDVTMSGSYTGDLTITGDAVTDKYRFRTSLATNPSTTVASIYDQSGVGLTLSAHNVSIRNYTGSAMVESARFTNSSLTVIGDLVAYGTPSDKNYKENIKPIESALDKAMKLQGVTFDWKKSDSILDIKRRYWFYSTRRTKSFTRTCKKK